MGTREAGWGGMKGQGRVSSLKHKLSFCQNQDLMKLHPESTDPLLFSSSVLATAFLWCSVESCVLRITISGSCLCDQDTSPEPQVPYCVCLWHTIFVIIFAIFAFAELDGTCSNNNKKTQPWGSWRSLAELVQAQGMEPRLARWTVVRPGCRELFLQSSSEAWEGCAGQGLASKLRLDAAAWEWGWEVHRTSTKNCASVTDFIAAEYSSLARCCGALASQKKGALSGQNILPAKASMSEDS